MQQLLIIGYVWIEKTTGAGNRMLQLLNVFKKQNYTITFATPAQKTENSLNLTELGVQEQSIELNSPTFDDFVSKLKPDVVLFDRFMMEEQFGWRVAEYCPKALRILDTEDLHFLRKTRHVQLKKGESFSTKALLQSDEAKREIAAILRCDMSLIISSYEIQLLKEVFNIDEALLYHFPFLLNRINEKAIENWMPFEERAHFVFVGNFFHAPNVDAVLQLKTIWKNIRKKLPNAELHIYGAYVTQQIQQLHKPKEGFIIKGFVENALAVVQSARVVLAPIRFGAGIKGKLTEAMECGTPSVTTQIGAEGMHGSLPWNGVVENDFKEFADKAVRLYTDKNLWLESQQNGVNMINSLYDKEKLAASFLNRLKKIQENLEVHRTQNFLGSMLQLQTLQATKFMSKWIEEKNK
ncbi:glycosyltransferase [Tenacibaculum tangerinum]|uniref:Glycosyltransferase n=1 Tax=Tenacibaculum tangerinum TaxID=3038772 RepID=A0ABY8L5P0_9FLAO|nr:glycosyltransferase [Tenacibaculum tangerinum]WGH75245.1 glycosyltransferase [Tenacibaculum tangerinum]